MVILLAVVMGARGIQWEMGLESNLWLAFNARCMGFLSRFRASPGPEPAEPPAPPKGSGERWRRGDFTSVHLGANEHAVKIRGEHPRVLPAFVVEFVYGCEEFRPLEGHIEEHAEKHGWDALQVASLRTHLPALTESRLLVSTGELRRAL